MGLYRYISFRYPTRIEDIAIRNQLYFAYPNQFSENDALDCKMYQVICKDSDDYKAVCKIYRESWFKKLTRTQVREEIKKQVKILGCKQRFAQNIADTFDQVTKQSFIDRKAGILCLSREYNESKMWDKYCSNNEGVCITINEDVLLNTLNSTKFTSAPDFDKYFSRDVKYIEHPFEIRFKDYEEYFGPLYKRMLFTKLSKFSFEKEYRIVIPECLNKRVSFPNQLVAKFIIKRNTDKKHKVYLRELISKLHQTIPLMEIE